MHHLHVQGRVRFDENGTVFQDRIRLLQYRRQSNSEEYYNRLCRRQLGSKYSNFSIVFIQLCSGTERLRFGYVDRMSNLVFTYEGNQNDFTVFPGKS